MAFRFTPTPTASVTPTLSLTASLTPSNTATGTQCPGLTPSNTPSNTATPTLTPSPTSTQFTPTVTPTNTSTATPTNTATPSQTPSAPPPCLCYYILNETASPGSYTYIPCGESEITLSLSGGQSVRVCSSDLPIVDVGLTVAPCTDITTCTQDSDCTGCSF
jgi:hypothetical protein